MQLVPSTRALDRSLPFRTPLPRPCLPRAMSEAPPLPTRGGAVRPRLALLVNPFYPKEPRASFGKHVLTPTLALTSIAAATPPGWRVRYWDENLLQGAPPIEPVPQVVGITVHLTFATRAYALAEAYRRLGAQVVLGGLHVMSCPDEAAAHADAIALGDGVALWPRILADAERGRVAPVYRAPFEGFAEAPVPRRDLLPRAAFLTTASVNATRGCSNRCDFCYLATRDVRVPCERRPPGAVAREILATGEPYAVFTDNNLGADRGYLHALCAALRPLGIIWSAAVTVDVTDDPSLVRAMAQAGCTGVFVGLESLGDENLSGAHKRTPPAADYARRVRIFHDHGVEVNGSFVFGFDGDRRDVFARTVDWIEEQRLECATFHILTPYPGTPLFERMRAAGRLLHTDWSRYDTAHAVFHPAHMSPEELEQGWAWCYQHLFSLASIWRRRPEDPSAVVPYVAMSLLYKRANPLWHWLIRHGRTHAVWSPLVRLARARHLRARDAATRIAPEAAPLQLA